MHKRILFVCSCLLVFTFAVSCGGGGGTPAIPPEGGGSAPGGAATFDMSKVTGTVSGKIIFDGTAPAPAKIQMSADPYCAMHSTNPTSEEVKVSDGGLENVIVYVKTGVPAGAFPTPTQPVTVDQHDCHYVPHVFTMQVNQPLQIKNSDMTLHNIHAWAEKNTPFNIGQPVPTETTKTFDKEEMPLPIRCDVHKWMGAFVGVFTHPFHTVSKGGGAYELKLPAGSYQIEAWHEKYGTQTQMVEVTDNGKVDINFTFKPDAAKTSD